MPLVFDPLPDWSDPAVSAPFRAAPHLCDTCLYENCDGCSVTNPRPPRRDVIPAAEGTDRTVALNLVPTGNLIPTRVAGMPVVAAVPDGDADSARVYVIALDARRERRPYVVFTTWWDGRAWQASNGHYDLPLSRAFGVMAERLGWQVRPAPDAAPGGDR